MSSIVYFASVFCVLSDFFEFFKLRNFSNSFPPALFLSSSVVWSPAVSAVYGWTRSILSGIVMLLSSAALRMICSASATLPLAYSHTTDSGSSLYYNIASSTQEYDGAELSHYQAAYHTKLIC